MDDVSRLLLRRQVEALRAVEGSVTEAVTLYIPPGKNLVDVVQRLRAEVSEADNIKNRVNRAGVVNSLTTILNRLKTFKTTPTNGLAGFSGADVLEVFETPEPVTSYFYRCGAGFDLTQLEAMLDSKTLYGMIVIERGGVTIGWLKGTRVILVVDEESRVPNKHGKGGQSQHRYERQTEEAAEAFYKKAAEMANATFMPKLDRLDGILIGGGGLTKTEWVEGEYLDYRLRQKLVKPYFDLGYLSDQGLKELSVRASVTIAGQALAKERDVIQAFLSAISTDTAVYGIENVRIAVKTGRVGRLLVSEAIPDALDWIEAGGATGAKITVVSEASDEGANFLKGFGGVGGILRYRQ
jgi:peptide chain release factor subunit 1